MRLKPKKSLGQNFLIDKNIRTKIIDSLSLDGKDAVLEIGAGRGEITVLIAEKAGQVYALEIDSSLCPILKDNLKAFLNIEVINKDILKLDLKRYFAGKRIRVVGNIPYYISSPILEHLIEHRAVIQDIFITVQKEFARRVVSPPGGKEYGAFSCFVQYYLEPEIVFDIKKNSFSPVPKVDSSLLKLVVRPHPAVNPKDEKLFFKLIRAAFGQRRKTLRNSLSELIPADRLNDFFKAQKIDPNTRPEKLSLLDFANLSNIVS
ncbi:MAG: 16S rRNA (adenine(1518)-N(6)/adenine(1519)-N(6))-dimethyltransferase RsmA [Candidatus Omnitrophica bacterium]|nr:16S rRNA (adenine(1518)-N(6)/adenine(1519)-N(6))-dimethyltransferase RsmA [Candidatus Omnitrophota bacterium]